MTEQEPREFTGHKDSLGQSIHIGDIICYQPSKSSTNNGGYTKTMNKANLPIVTSSGMRVARVVSAGYTDIICAFLTATDNSRFVKKPQSVLVIPKNEYLRNLPNEWLLEVVFDLDSVEEN